MDKIQNYMSAIDDVLAEQPPQWQKSVADTLCRLREEIPNETDRINKSFEILCKKIILNYSRPIYINLSHS